jgi:hypothetical protein
MFILLPTLERRMFVALVVCKVGQSLLAYIQDMGFTVTTFSCATGSQNVVQGHKNSKINLITLTQIRATQNCQSKTRCTVSEARGMSTLKKATLQKL